MQREVVTTSLQLSVGSKPVPASVIDRWTKPQQGWRKLNSDGAVDRGVGLAACGGLIRDESVHLLNNHGSFDVAPTNVHSIVEVMDRPWLIRISHVGRGSNCAADWMAKQANFDDLLCHRYLTPLDDISLLLQQDVDD
ncbi:hypothetical protein V6N12_009787 [Hibiscus sabdariffa]|uniref:RNase H type-1 domain-containing protein n=1 Tax=Hibiscus sabdariffa TaxID=183260 RepID=A0ABR2EBR3_9ROSI